MECINCNITFDLAVPLSHFLHIYVMSHIFKLRDTEVYRGSLKVQNYVNKFWLPRQILEVNAGFTV